MAQRGREAFIAGFSLYLMTGIVVAADIPPSYGLLPAEDFQITTGSCGDCSVIPQALWFFRKETIAIPKPGHPVAGFERGLLTREDIGRWNQITAPGAAINYPSLVWIGAPQVIGQARLGVGGKTLGTPEGETGFALASRLTSNRSYYDTTSTAYFSGRELRLRGYRQPDRFIARTLWPVDFRIDPDATVNPVAATPEALRAFVRAEPQGGARSRFSTQVIWQRDPDAAKHRAGRAIIGFILNGAQGDDDEALAGHFALVTGRIGREGDMHDWLVSNFYTLDSESEKGIIAAMLPLDSYLADLNSGQTWYRPSYLLVATLRDDRTAVHLQSALARVFNQFYRHQFIYQHARANCTGISVSTLRGIGWEVPAMGPTSWMKAIAALPAVSVATGSLTKGKAVFDYLTEDQTRLFPAVAFEQTGADLLQLVTGTTARTLTRYEAFLRQDVEEIMLVRIPQFPSSRAWGNYPVASADEYQARVPKDPARRQIVPVGPRPFPPDLKDPESPPQPPLRSDYAIAGYVLVMLLAVVLLVRHVVFRRRSKE